MTRYLRCMEMDLRWAWRDCRCGWRDRRGKDGEVAEEEGGKGRRYWQRMEEAAVRWVVMKADVRRR